MIYLASKSPRRQELLRQIGLDFELLPIDIDETQQSNEDAADFVVRMAIEKAATGFAVATTKFPVLAADTIVVMGDKTYGKPANRQLGVDMLRALAGSWHRVLTAVAVHTAKQKEHRLVSTDVQFCELTDDEIEQYWNSGEPLDKAGAYAIQGRAAAFIKQIRGSYSGVVGLPLCETVELLREVGIRARGINRGAL